MWQSLNTNNYTEVSRKFELVLSWLGEVGLKIADGRVRVYQKIIDELAQAQISNDYSKFEAKYQNSDFVNMAFEISQLIGIYEGLGQLNLPEIKDRLFLAAKGHTLYSEDKADRSGRDFAFELFVASLFARCGTKIDLGSEADVCISFQKQSAFVECKRPRNSSSVERNVKKALKQLDSRYEEFPESYGLIAVSIDKLLNPTLGQLVVSNSAEAGTLASRIIAHFIDTHGHLWKHPKVDHRTIGCMVVLSAPAYVKPQKLTLAVHQVAFSVLAEPLSPKNWWLHEITKNAFQ